MHSAHSPCWTTLASRRFRPHIGEMPYSSLRDFIDRLETAGRLVRVGAPVSPYLELTEIQTRLLAESGPAALFENVTREAGGSYGMPVLTNLFGTVERVAWGMDREPDGLREIGRTLAFLKQPEPPGGWREALRHAAAAANGHGDASTHGQAPHRARRSYCAAATSICLHCRSRPAGRASRRR